MTSFLDAYRRLNDVLAAIILFASKLLVGSWVLALFTGAATRYITGVGYDWVLELPPIMVPWVVFPLAAVLLRRDHHITVDFLPLLLGEAAKRWLRVLVLAIALVASAVFFVAGVQATMLFRSMGQLTQMELQFPLWYMYLSFPVGFGVMALFALESLLQALRRAIRPEAPVPASAGGGVTSDWVD